MVYDPSQFRMPLFKDYMKKKGVHDMDPIDCMAYIFCEQSAELARLTRREEEVSNVALNLQKELDEARKRERQMQGKLKRMSTVKL